MGARGIVSVTVGGVRVRGIVRVGRWELGIL